MDPIIQQVKDHMIKSGYDIDLRLREVGDRKLEISMVIRRVGNKTTASFRVLFGFIRFAKMTRPADNWLQERFPGTKVGPDNIMQAYSRLAAVAREDIGVWKEALIEC
jgi:hypothetical protein